MRNAGYWGNRLYGGNDLMKQSDYNPHLNATILQAVDTQLRDDTPPITRTTLERLKNEGHSEAEAKRLIGAALAAEIYEIMKSAKPFDLVRYTRNLNRLPTMPWEQEGH